MTIVKLYTSPLDQLSRFARTVVNQRAPTKEVTLGDTTEDMLTRAIAGEPIAQRTLVERFTPIVQSRVARQLLGSNSYRDLRQDVLEYTQDILLYLFSENAKALQNWREEGGMSLDNYVGLIAQRRVISALRSGRRNPWRENEALDNVEEPASTSGDTEHQSMQSNLLNVVLERMQSQLSPLGWHLFDLLYLQEKSVPETAEATSLSTDAIYAWRSRLRKLANQIRQTLDNSERITLESSTGTSS